jgi:hypothetical protein
MARQTKTPDANEPAAAGTGSDTSSDLTRDGLNGAREWWQQSLTLAQGLADWLEQTQRMNTDAARAWAESLAKAEREVRQAEDLAALMAVPANLVNHQLDLALRHFNDQSKRLIETELEWADQTRERALALGQTWMAGRPDGDGAASRRGGDGASLPAAEALKRTQDAWSDMWQRWIDGMNTGMKPQAASASR